jgi:hypothetical protein
MTYGVYVEGYVLEDAYFQNLISGPKTYNYSYYAHNGAGQIPDLATTFTDGFGMQQSPIYFPLTNTNVYAKYADAVFPE